VAITLCSPETGGSDCDIGAVTCSLDAGDRVAPTALSTNCCNGFCDPPAPRAGNLRHRRE